MGGWGRGVPLGLHSLYLGGQGPLLALPDRIVLLPFGEWTGVGGAKRGTDGPAEDAGVRPSRPADLLEDRRGEGEVRTELAGRGAFGGALDLGVGVSVGCDVRPGPGL